MNIEQIENNLVPVKVSYRDDLELNLEVKPDADTSESKSDPEYLSIKLGGWDLTKGTGKEEKPLEVTLENLQWIQKRFPELFLSILDAVVDTVTIPLGKLKILEKSANG